MIKTSLCLLCLSCSSALWGNQSLQVEFNQAQALLQRYVPGLSADELLTLEYTPSQAQQAQADNAATTDANVNADADADADDNDNAENNSNPDANASTNDQDASNADGPHTFMALSQLARTATPQGAVLILHDVGQNIDWPQVIKPSRHFLPDVGWMTLSMAVPKGRIYPQLQFETAIFDRIKRAHNYLNEQGQFNIVLLGSGTGAYWLTRYLNEQVDLANNAGFYLISVNGRSTGKHKADEFAKQLGLLTLPILDLYQPRNDYQQLQAKLRRAEMLRQQRQNYQQIALHYQQANTDAQCHRLTRRIWGWLKQNAGGEEAQVKAPKGDAKF